MPSPAMSEREQQALVHGYLSDPWWRLDNLYHVVNEQGVLVPFRMRPAQRQLFREMHEKNLILKARQLGFSTAIDLYLLDQALFSKNVKCGIVAQDKQAAAEIFRTKIEVPFDHLPGWLAGCFHAVKRHGGASGGISNSRTAPISWWRPLFVRARYSGCIFLSMEKFAPNIRPRRKRCAPGR
ncbi:Uncharacterised protein [Edwardsiella tarda]|nr:Uncharacterised protein [Edwardsiella tarda]